MILNQQSADVFYSNVIPTDIWKMTVPSFTLKLSSNYWSCISTAFLNFHVIPFCWYLYSHICLKSRKIIVRSIYSHRSGRGLISLMLSQLGVIFMIIWYLVCRLSYCSLFYPALVWICSQTATATSTKEEGTTVPSLGLLLRRLLPFNTWNVFLLQKIPNCLSARAVIMPLLMSSRD